MYVNAGHVNLCCNTDKLHDIITGKYSFFLMFSISLLDTNDCVCGVMNAVGSCKEYGAKVQYKR